MNPSRPTGCYFPLNSIAIHPQGFGHFCESSKLVIDPDTEGYALQRQSIHQELLSGRFPESCRGCQRREDEGLESRRTRAIDRKILRDGRAAVVGILSQQTHPVIRHLDISFSNLCNLRCAMCSSEYSSGWIADDRHAVREGLRFRSSSFTKVVRMSDPLMEEILESSDDIDLILIKGGEPTWEPRCFEFLKRLAQRRQGRMPWIYFQTNGTRPPKDWLPLLPETPIEVGFSIDGWGPVYEWVRDGSFAKVIENFRILADESQIVNLKMNFTLSAFNAFHLPDFVANVLNLKRELPKFSHCSLFQWAPQAYASPLNLGLSDRLRIRSQTIQAIGDHRDFFEHLENVLGVLERPQLEIESRQQLRAWIDFLNLKRQPSLFDLEPRLMGSIQA